jgi:tRNA modification GTPase
VNRVAVLTPPGTGAIATVAVVGPTAWDAVRRRFRPVGGKPVPDVPPARRVWFGTIGDGPGDEVVVALTRDEPESWVEVHCHGGRRVVRWLVEQFQQDGCVEVRWQDLVKPTRGHGWALSALTQAPTLRTASILLDQYHGAFASAVRDILTALERGEQPAALAQLAQLAPVGRHLVRPWKVAIAGAPNVGKSSLINALAGYQRSIVAPVAGTTRDVVTVTVALDGWPVELADTAGLRENVESLEAAGIDRARRQLAEADLVYWVLDGSEPNPARPTGPGSVVIINKTDLPAAWSYSASDGLLVSAATGAGVPELAADVVRRLVPVAPAPGAAVPYTPELADRIEQASQLVTAGESAAAREILADCLRNE